MAMVMFSFPGGRLYGWTTPPQKLYGLAGQRGGVAFGLAHSSSTRSCAKDLRLYARLEAGQFAHVGTVSAGTSMMRFSNLDTDHYERIAFRHPWLSAGKLYVRKDERATCPKP